MRCPYCKDGHTRPIKDITWEEQEWCYCCGAMFRIKLIKPPKSLEEIVLPETVTRG